MSNVIGNLDVNTFLNTNDERKKIIENASAAPLTGTFPVNVVAKRLHPNRQYMKIAAVTDMGQNTKKFRLVPNPDRGTTECAYFIAGQYISVFETIKGMEVNRAYSIASAPFEALEGFYEIAIKNSGDGLVSTYVCDNWKVGDEVEVSGPIGSFAYSRLRDAETVIGVAGGSGITPFVSFARAIAHGDENFNLVLLYGSRTADEILYKDEFDKLAAECSKVKVVHVISDEEKEGFEHGFISAELIKKYAPADKPYSVFVCGPQGLYDFMDKEYEKLGIAKKFFREELYGEIHDPNTQSDYPGCDQKTVKITVSVRDRTRTIDADVNDSILQALEKAGIAAPASCRSGECGLCRSQLVSGEVYCPKKLEGRRLADFKFNGIHICATYPLSDLEIEVPPVKGIYVQ
ncbi:MAG: iron-sulfur cluster-binding domain-containing protein [Mogibacterium sp.]|nr:iron-sulfur cluster-binding domain-containing protein [Mogibacterium sp.]